MDRIIDFIRSSRCEKLPDVLVFLSIGLPFLIFFGGELLFQKDPTYIPLISQIAGIMLFFLSGFFGLVVMIRREMKQVIKIRGKSAQVIGFILWISSWSLVLYMLLWIYVTTK